MMQPHHHNIIQSHHVKVHSIIAIYLDFYPNIPVRSSGYC